MLILTPIFHSAGGKTFKGIQADMNRMDGTHFARDRFASNVDPGIIQAWLIRMHKAKQHVANTMAAFEEWDGMLNEYW
ncbi:hypothetical protein [Listeria ilorinensis]|uniref:hypothetical protein n=1 Tax=Listeria ilorinensis TaxID=2867439 RepID=UPI001EF733D5|nr:hypothetical protein [Listeria ilorinensis]